MIKSNRKRLRSARPKAFPGEAVVAAGMNVAATLGAAAINANATNKAAKQQADATKFAAKQQADALALQNENAVDLQEKQLTFTRTQNERNRDLQKQIQMNLQMLTGQQNENERLEAAKIQVKNGGSARRRLRNAYEDGRVQTMNSSYGGANIPFKVTDGGGVIPLATTPEGYDLYEIVGNDHEHYHKAQGGKNKTGVGIKFYGQKDGTIEGEGDQNTGQGELMLITPNDAKFISKHTIKGFNPTKAVLGGMHPLAAFNQQEAIKDMYGISDSGMNISTTPVKEMKRRIRPFGGNNYPNIIPDLSLDYLAPVATGVGYIVKNRNEYNSRSLKKCGGRKKAKYGNPPGDFYSEWLNRNPYGYNSYLASIKVPQLPSIDGYLTPNYSILQSTRNFNIDLNNGKQIPDYKGLNTGGYSGFDDVSKGNLWGAGITGIGNFIGAGINSWANRRASGILTSANTDASRIISDAYHNFKTIDLNDIKDSDFRAAHAMAAITTPYVNINPELALIDRSLQRRLSAINRNSLSGAAALSRIGRAETDAYDMRSKVFSDAERLRQEIRRHNTDLITQTANENANRDTQANIQKTNALIDVAKFNAETLNEGIASAAQAEANALTNNAQILAGARQTNAGLFGNALTTSLSGIGNALATNGKMDHEYAMTMLGATDDAVLRSIYANPDTRQSRNAAYSIWMRYKNSSDENYKRIADELARDYNFS